MSKEKWHLLHEEKPVHDTDCYWGFRNRLSKVILCEGTWGWYEDDWADKDFPECRAWANWIPALLPIDIFWCRAEDFSSKEEALSSLSALIGLPTSNEQGVE